MHSKGPVIPPLPTFRFPEGYDPKRLLDELARRYTVRKNRPTGMNLSIYDTFDWRLYHRSLLLYRSRNAFHLRKLFETGAICGAKIPTAPVFVGDFPEGKLKDRLVPIVRNRALIRLVDVSSRETPYALLGQDGAVLASIVIEELAFSGQSGAKGSAAYLRLPAAGDFPRGSEAMKIRLGKIGFAECRDREVFFPALKAVGITPGGYSTKFTETIDPGMRSDEALKRILRFHLHVMKTNEGNIEKDLDPEFLHDFRVALRRASTALKEMGQAFPPAETDRFGKLLANAGKISGPLRDLDVYLQEEGRHKARLPSALRDDIDPLFKYLRKERSRAFRNLVRHLRSAKYRKHVEACTAFLGDTSGDPDEASEARRPVGEVAGKSILAAYRRIEDLGNEALLSPKDKKLHHLRIACKELRYLLEFFAGLLPRKKADAAIRRLKELQDLLGRFNDLRVQEKYLLSAAGELPRRGKRGTRILLAIGSLLGTLYAEKKSVKDAFARTYAGFASRATRKLLREIVAPIIPATPSRSTGGLP